MDLPYEMLFTVVYVVIDDWCQRDALDHAGGQVIVRAREAGLD